MKDMNLKERHVNGTVKLDIKKGGKSHRPVTADVGIGNLWCRHQLQCVCAARGAGVDSENATRGAPGNAVHVYKTATEKLWVNCWVVVVASGGPSPILPGREKNRR